ncbi:MAG: hypothetical protein ACXWIU_08005 [Limisphaerales bacterium]
MARDVTRATLPRKLKANKIKATMATTFQAVQLFRRGGGGGGGALAAITGGTGGGGVNEGGVVELKLEVDPAPESGGVLVEACSSIAPPT